MIKPLPAVPSSSCNNLPTSGNPPASSTPTPTSSSSKVLLLAALVQQLKVQQPSKSLDTPKASSDPDQSSLTDAATLARLLTGNPKLMIELSVELTKLALSEMQ